MNKLIAQGAEAKIFHTGKFVIKHRISKGYRHPILDKKIIESRTKKEAKLLTKAHALKINVPKVLDTNKLNTTKSTNSREVACRELLVPSEFTIKIEYIDGDKLSETLNSYQEKKQFNIMQQLGKQVALLHKNNIIHGDLTTSNTILSNEKVFLIDFGLGFISTKIEDKAVDLHLIKQALEAKHFRSPDHLLGQNHEDLFRNFIKGYIWSDSKKIIERLKVVERRGRYKH